MNILHLICSPKGHASQSAGFSRHIVEKLVACEPSSQVTVRCLNSRTMPHIDCEFSLGPKELGAGDFEHGTFRLSDELIEELEESNAIVLATPMHNLSVPSVLKAWVDHVVRSHRTYRYSDDKTVGLLKDRPVFAVISSGGSFRDGEHPEFLRNYLRAIFGIMGIKSIEFFVLDHMQSGKLNSMLPAAEALSILSNAAPAITHERVHALWSQFH